MNEEETGEETIPADEEGNEEITSEEEGVEKDDETPNDEEGKEEEGNKEDEAPKPGEPKYTKNVKKRIDKITRDKNEAQREAAYWKGKAEGMQPAPGEKVPAPSFTIPKPREDDYASTDEYDDAMFEWRTAKKDSEKSEKNKSEVAALEQDKILGAFDEMIEASGIREEYPDFDEVKECGFYSPTLTELVLTSEEGPRIAYHLGENPEESKKISRMSVTQAAKAIARLEDKFSKKPLKKKITKAPDPISPVDGGKPVTGKDIGKMPMNEYAAKKNKDALY